jgi:hypothetical protein
LDAFLVVLHQLNRWKQIEEKNPESTDFSDLRLSKADAATHIHFAMQRAESRVENVPQYIFYTKIS